MKRLLLYFLAPLVLILAGCADRWKADVESNTTWSGDFSGRTVDGYGNQRVDLGNDAECCVVQKKTSQGFLKVSLVNTSGNPFAANGESKETTASYGVVSVCNR